MAWNDISFHLLVIINLLVRMILFFKLLRIFGIELTLMT